MKKYIYMHQDVIPFAGHSALRKGHCYLVDEIKGGAVTAEKIVKSTFESVKESQSPGGPIERKMVKNQVAEYRDKGTPSSVQQESRRERLKNKNDLEAYERVKSQLQDERQRHVGAR